MKRSIIFIFALLMIGGATIAQQLPQFTSYQLNPFSYNPAFAGVDGTTQMNALIRNQWAGVNEAPETNVLNAYGLLHNEKMAIGGTAFKDAAGPDSRVGLSASYAYHLKVSDKMNLSLGLSLGLLQYRLDHTVIIPFDDGDPVFNSGILSSVVPTASFGAYLHGQDFYVSFAAPQILSSSFNVTDDLDNGLLFGGLTNHFFLGGGYIKELSSDFDLEPSILLMYAQPAPIAIDVMTKVTYKDYIWSAVSYRLGDALSLYIGYDISDQFYIAYGHDFVVSELSSATSGSNEFKLGFRFLKPE
ncbi:MAG: type IX secretion system membrane protein PorP/SprF [Flavobacteriales bacterium]|tara:strand:- start:2111 stop:3013 length:903 start_codon:yes stop_codon:yes gene_type:complete